MFHKSGTCEMVSRSSLGKVDVDIPEISRESDNDYLGYPLIFEPGGEFAFGR